MTIRRTFPHGFTLVELLVVVAIISLLLSILLPAMGKAKEVARRAVCMSNERQQTIAYRSFANDYKGNVPLQYGTHQRRNSSYFKVNNRFHNFGNLWRADLLSDEKMFVCASYEGKPVYLGCNDPSVDEFEDLPVASMFNSRPVRNLSNFGATNDIEESLVPLDNHNRHAIVSERLYGWYNSTPPFHKAEGVIAGYGDGHAAFVADPDGSRFINELASARENISYYIDGDGDGELEDGAWLELDLSE